MRLRPPARIPILVAILLVVATCTTAAGTASPGGTRSPDATTSPVPSCPSVPPSSSPGGSSGATVSPCALGAIETSAGPPASEPAGQHWLGTLTLHTFREYDPQHPGTMTCEDDWTADFTLIVATDATATGTGVATLVAGPTCTFPITGFGHRIEFTTQGAAFSDRLQFTTELTFVERPGDWAGFQVALFTVTGGPGPVITAQRTAAGSALGPVSLTGEISGQPTTAIGTVELTCGNC